ncbi:uncharacterized protein B0T23DRAFT_432979 [Neurospora hispaniola]|uniref:Uncharacterized protein n=1 Tax=Neurospora hispaniola TaxID=588809 RepID=A0AAJ0MM42_9PEZI|nr:hypothetical protein B0T23DRAFT_432979 [Neurospora hispaniola]
MVRVKFSTKPPPHWKAHSLDTRKRQQTKKGRQSEADNDDETWLLLPEPSSNTEQLEVVEIKKVVIEPPRAGTRLHAAMELIPVEDIVAELYYLGCPPTNNELVTHARMFFEGAVALDATGKVKDAASDIILHLASIINGGETGAFPMGHQYELLNKQVTFLSALLDLTDRPQTPVTCAAKPATTKPARKRVSQLQHNIPKTDRVLRSRATKSN